MWLVHYTYIIHGTSSLIPDSTMASQNLVYNISHTVGGGTERGTEKPQRETQDKESMRLGEDTIVLIEESPSHVAISSSAFLKALL